MATDWKTQPGNPEQDQTARPAALKFKSGSQLRENGWAKRKKVILFSRTSGKEIDRKLTGGCLLSVLQII
jgi:hypothetical protein